MKNKLYTAPCITITSIEQSRIKQQVQIGLTRKLILTCVHYSRLSHGMRIQTETHSKAMSSQNFISKTTPLWEDYLKYSRHMLFKYYPKQLAVTQHIEIQ